MPGITPRHFRLPVQAFHLRLGAFDARILQNSSLLAHGSGADGFLDDVEGIGHVVRHRRRELIMVRSRRDMSSILN